jgi:hypothetical protein
MLTRSPFFMQKEIVMSTDKYTKMVLTVIALSLMVIALRPLLTPTPIVAATVSSDFYVEPGIYSLRAADRSRVLVGKVVVDLRTGKIWGFPTGDPSSPYPYSLAGSSDLPVSRPFLLGKFDLSATGN